MWALKNAHARDPTWLLLKIQALRRPGARFLARLCPVLPKRRRRPLKLHGRRLPRSPPISLPLVPLRARSSVGPSGRHSGPALPALPARQRRRWMSRRKRPLRRLPITPPFVCPLARSSVSLSGRHLGARRRRRRNALQRVPRQMVLLCRLPRGLLLLTLRLRRAATVSSRRCLVCPTMAHHLSMRTPKRRAMAGRLNLAPAAPVPVGLRLGRERAPPQIQARKRKKSSAGLITCE